MSKRKKSQDVSARRRRMQEKGIPWSYVIPVLVIVLIVGGLVYYEFAYQVTPSNGYIPPPPGNGNYPFPCVSESLFLHIHPWLIITINGVNVTVAPGIGIKNPVQAGTYNGAPIYGGGANSCFEPVHTHDNTGIIHIESSTNTNYTLGNFFQIWAATYAYVNISGSEHPIIFNATDIFGYTVSGSSSLKLLVDGQTSTQYDNLVLNTLAYCSAANSGSPPCSVTAAGNPSWNGGTSPYPYGTGHTIHIVYTSS